MSKSILRESPLVRFDLHRQQAKGANGAGVIAWERAFHSHINLRGDPDSGAFLSAVKAVLGCALPLEPNTAASGRDNSVLWLGPNEWLIVASEERGAQIAAGLGDALEGTFYSVVEVSGGQTIVGLRGKRVYDLFAKGCPLDLHPREFGPGRCAQSHLAKAPILIRQIDEEPTFELIIRRSFSDYLWLWLEDAAGEYGFAVVSAPETGKVAAGQVSVTMIA